MIYIKIIIASFAILFTSCTKEEKVIEDKPIPITLTNVEKASLSKPIKTSGKVSAGIETILSFKTGGIVEKILVKEGESVTKGQILAQLNLSEINAKVSQAKEAFLKAERDYVRINSLYKDSVVTLEQFQNVETALRIAEANLEIAKFNLSYSKITAPRKGKIFRKFVDENQMVASGTPIIQFGSSSENWIIKCGISDINIAKIQLGDKANVRFDGFSNKIIEGTINEVASSANPRTGTFEVEILIKENKNLISGMVADIEIFSSTSEEGYLVPIQSVVEAEGSEGTIFILSGDGNHVQSVKVELGEIIKNSILVKNSQIELIEVVNEGVEYVTNNSKVVVVKQEKYK